MQRGPATASEFEKALQGLIDDAKWNGLSGEEISSILRAKSHTANSK